MVGPSPETPPDANAAAHHPEPDEQPEEARLEEARLEEARLEEAEIGRSMIANAQRRHGTLGGVVAAGMFGLDQALGRRVKQDAPVVVSASSEPVDIDTDGIAVELDTGTSVVAPALPRSAPKVAARRRRRGR